MLRSTSDIAKWQDDPELQRQIAYVAQRWFVTVQPNPGLSDRDLAAVKRTIAHGRR